jgi:hypothetical protein
MEAPLSLSLLEEEAFLKETSHLLNISCMKQSMGQGGRENSVRRLGSQALRDSAAKYQRTANVRWDVIRTNWESIPRIVLTTNFLNGTFHFPSLNPKLISVVILNY